jgi:peptidylprolyl isomerase
MKHICVMAALFAAFTASAFAQDEPVDPESPAGILERTPDSVWRTVDPENLWVIDLPSGPIYVELRPDFSEQHAERIRTLTRAGFYNGTIFHRVIDGFMAQGGDPTGTGKGGSDLPDLPGIFVKPLKALEDFVPVGRDDRAAQIGFLGSMPVGSQPPSLAGFVKTDDVAAWPLHCAGVLSMARAEQPNSANSQFFLLFGDNRRGLDQQYTAFGRVLDGYRNVRRINRGEPPERPTPILRARMMTDLPPEEQITFEVLRPESEAFKAWLRAGRLLTDDGYFVDTCSVNVPVRKGGEIL